MSARNMRSGGPALEVAGGRRWARRHPSVVAVVRERQVGAIPTQAHPPLAAISMAGSAGIEGSGDSSAETIICSFFPPERRRRGPWVLRVAGSSRDGHDAKGTRRRSIGASVPSQVRGHAPDIVAAFFSTLPLAI